MNSVKHSFAFTCGRFWPPTNKRPSKCAAHIKPDTISRRFLGLRMNGVKMSKTTRKYLEIILLKEGLHYF